MYKKQFSILSMTCIWIFINPETKCNNWENTTENKRITLRNSNTKTAFQRFMANTWTTTRSLHSGFKRSGADLVTTMTSIDWNQWLILSGKLRTAPTTHVQTKWHRYKNLEEKRKYQTQRRTSCILSKKIPHHPRFQFQASWIYF